MAIARSFRVLALYDVLVNLIPGFIWVIVLIFLLPVKITDQQHPTTILVSGLVALAFVSGHVIQAIGSWLDGTPTTFGDTVSAIRSDNPSRSPIALTEIEYRFWPLCKQKFGLTDDFNNNGKLLKLILSHLETTPNTRALRFQALHAFHRSMWAASVITAITAASLLGSNVLRITPSVSSLLEGSILLIALTSIHLFAHRKRKFNRLFVEYTLIDFYDSCLPETEKANLPDIED